MVALATTDAGAQVAPACAYRECALAIQARWNGLAVVRGQAQEHVATLSFFAPRGVEHAFPGGNDSTAAWARRASRRRKAAAFFTDVGLLAIVPAAARAAFGNPIGRAASTGAAIGAAMFVVSVPLQFSADNALSRAVWWHNLPLTRP